MKPLEKRFFRYCMKNLKHVSDSDHTIPNYCWFRVPKDRNIPLSFNALADEFAKKYNVNYGQLKYYIKKWRSKNICITMEDDGVEGGVCFQRSRVNINQYIDAIPMRILSHNSSLQWQIKRYRERNKHYEK